MRRAQLLVVWLSMALGPAPVARATETGGPAASGSTATIQQCENAQTVLGEMGYPREALRAGILNGHVVIEFKVGENGSTTDVRVTSSTYRLFTNVAIDAARSLQCKGAPPGSRVVVPFAFRMAN